MQPMYEPGKIVFPKPKPFERSLQARRLSDESLSLSPKVALQRKMGAVRKFTKAWITIRKQIFIAALRRNARLNRPSIQAKKIMPKQASLKPGNTPLLPAAQKSNRPKAKQVQPMKLAEVKQPVAKPQPKIRNQPKPQPKAQNALGNNPPKVKEPQPRQTTQQRPVVRPAPAAQPKPQPARNLPKIAKPVISPSKKKLTRADYATRITAIVRMFLLRRRYSRILWAQRIISKNMKQFLVTRLYKHIHDAIVSIQTWWREMKNK